MRLAILAATLIAVPCPGQTPAEHVALGDREHDALNAAGALRHYEQAIRVDPNNADALWRAAREAIDLGEFDDRARDSLYSLGEQYARRAVRADPGSSVTHFALARALGRKALSLGVRDRVKFAAEVRAEALEALRIDSTTAGALHVLGMWHANIMRLSGVSRFVAKNLLGGKVFDEANWDDAVAYLERAAALEPARVVHRLALAGVYADRGSRDQARASYQAALQLPATDFNDRHYQRQASEAVAKLR